MLPVSWSEILFPSLSMAGSFSMIKSQLRWHLLRENFQPIYLNRSCYLLSLHICPPVCLPPLLWSSCLFGIHLLLHLPTPHLAGGMGCFVRVQSKPVLLTIVCPGQSSGHIILLGEKMCVCVYVHVFFRLVHNSSILFENLSDKDI